MTKRQRKRHSSLRSGWCNERGGSGLSGQTATESHAVITESLHTNLSGLINLTTRHAGCCWQCFYVVSFSFLSSLDISSFIFSIQPEVSHLNVLHWCPHRMALQQSLSVNSAAQHVSSAKVITEQFISLVTHKHCVHFLLFTLALDPSSCNWVFNVPAQNLAQ